jgi:cytochrome P450
MDQNPDSNACVIAPDHIHTTDEAAMETIYDRTSIKSRFYVGMGSWKGMTGTSGFSDYPSEDASRSNLIKRFQDQNFATLVSQIQRHVIQLANILQALSTINDKVDGVVCFRLLAPDLVTDILWDEEDTLLSRMHGNTPDNLHRFHAFSQWNALKASFPGVDAYVRFFGTRKWRNLRWECGQLDVTAKQALQLWHERGSQRHSRDIFSMLKSMEAGEDPRKHLATEHIPTHMVEMLAAGSSTTSHTVAFACFLLARHPAEQVTLRKELFKTFPDPENIDPAKMMSLPYLNAVLKETMRLYPTIPGSVERHIGTYIKLCGYIISAGTKVSMAAYNQGRLSDVFPEPEQWQPERWIGTDKEQEERMELNWLPFGTGSRSCPGSNLAITELKYMIGTIFRLFTSEVPDGHADEVIELADIFAAGSRSGHVWLKFKDDKERVV